MTDDEGCVKDIQPVEKLPEWAYNHSQIDEFSKRIPVMYENDGKSVQKRGHPIYLKWMNPSSAFGVDDVNAPGVVELSCNINGNQHLRGPDKSSMNLMCWLQFGGLYSCIVMRPTQR